MAALAIVVLSAALLTSCLKSNEDNSDSDKSPLPSVQTGPDQVTSDNIVTQPSATLISQKAFSVPNSSDTSQQRTMPSSDQRSPTPGNLSIRQKESKPWDQIIIDNTVITPGLDSSDLAHTTPVSGSSSDSEATSATPLQSSKTVEVNADEFRQLLRRDAIAPIYTPQFLPHRAASLNPAELVIGVSIDGESKAYPIGPLARREMVNDVIAGVPILVTW